MNKMNDAILAYHGTATDFSNFRFAKKDTHPSKIGIWFASKEEAAIVIAKSAIRMANSAPRVIAVQLKLSAPAVFETYEDYLMEFRKAGDSAVKLRRQLIQKGFDGVMISQSDTDTAGLRTDYAVFEQSQIKILLSSSIED